MRTTILCLALCTGLVFAGPTRAGNASAAAACKSTVSGDLRLHTLKSAIFGNERTIRVLLPPGYGDAANKDRRYPVLYMLDGQNVFDACLSDVSHHEWSVDETVQQLMAENKIPALIVVGVDHAGKDRAHEYLPYKDFVGNPDMDEPAGKLFPDFMTREVMPLVDSHYRTLPGQPNTGIGGSSYGGVATLYALLAKPGRFGYGLIESPSLQVGMGQLVRDTSPLVALPVKVFVAFGGKEADDPVISEKLIGLVRQVETNFHAAGYDDSNFRFVLDPDAVHTEAAWEKRLPDALTFLFGDWKP
ncbi:MAG: alpha/beta hydrolase-fold protein, partial [Proteobacteria bacterium]|nr:alpha/beta hydrolase-fold protein [Pseudomonadota bacterium]